MEGSVARHVENHRSGSQPPDDFVKPMSLSAMPLLQGDIDGHSDSRPVIAENHAVRDLFQQGLAYHKTGDLVNASLCYQQVLNIDANHAGSWHFLGVIALTQRDYSFALERIRRAIALCDTKPVYFNNFGVVLKSLERFQEAKEAFEKAVTLNPNYADAWSNLGQILLILKQDHCDIEHAIQKALRLKPEHPDALSHLAELRHRQERYVECAEILKTLLPSHPNDHGLQLQIAECYLTAKMPHEAMEYFSRAASRLPEHADVQQRLGVVLGETGMIEAAKKQFRKAASLPNGKPIWRWKHLWYCPVYFDNTQQIDDYWHNLNHDLDEAIAENNVYDWRTLVYDGFTSSFHLPHHDQCCREVKEKFTRLFAPSFAQFQRPDFKPKSKIRVGFLVTPGHEGGFLRYTTGIIERLDPNRFEIVLLYNKTTAHRYQRISQRDNITHVMFDWNFEHSVKVIGESECDIIYYWKVGADVWNTFLPMCRLVPIQFTSWGTHGTCGVEHVDYSLSFDLAEVKNAQEHYTEKLFLIHEAPTFQPRMSMPESFSRRELGLPETGAIYFCPHRLSKYHPDYDSYLKGILESDPNGHIVLLMGHSPLLAEQFKTRMRRNIGETLFTRMIFLPAQHVHQYNRLMAAATMILDSHIYSGGITSYDAFSYGVPCVTQAGQLLIQRYPLASYNAMGIEEAPIATNRDEYIRFAVKLGADKEYRQFICNQIKERSDILFDQPGVIRQFESFLETMISTYR